MSDFDTDFVVVGSGFGGSVAALRLSEKGYRVLVLERGPRWAPGDFPKSNWNLKKSLWLPFAKCFGILRLSLLSDVFVLSGSGVGGGSLVYANTLYVPPDAFFRSSGTLIGAGTYTLLALLLRLEEMRMIPDLFLRRRIA